MFSLCLSQMKKTSAEGDGRSRPSKGAAGRRRGCRGRLLPLLSQTGRHGIMVNAANPRPKARFKLSDDFFYSRQRLSGHQFTYSATAKDRNTLSELHRQLWDLPESQDLEVSVPFNTGLPPTQARDSARPTLLFHHGVL